jgi:hypothetical protein
MAAARVSKGVGKRENRGCGSGCPCSSLSMARRRPSMTSATGKTSYPAAKQPSPRTACPVLSTVEVKKMGYEKSVLPLRDVQNHHPTTA